MTTGSRSSGDPLLAEPAETWAVQPGCGAVSSFVGTARHHSGDRTGVTLLEYEAYEDQALPRLAEIAGAARRRWPDLGRLALLHRLGPVEVGQVAVVVVASAPHRGEAFAACRFGIDALKATVPIWKRETWAGGTSWGLDAQHLVDLAEFERQLGDADSTDSAAWRTGRAAAGAGR